MGLLVVRGVDIGIDEDEISRFDLVARGGKVEEQNAEQNGKEFHYLPLFDIAA